MSNYYLRIKIICFVFFLTITLAYGQDWQRVEGFDQVEFHHGDANRSAYMDFRGFTRGYMTAAWWVPGHTNKNIVSWKSAIVPEKKATIFSFIATTSVLPSEFSRGPSARLTINGKYALTFTLGLTRNFTWKEGEYELRYLSKRVEFPYFGSHREFEISGNSGIYQLRVPESTVNAGEPAVIQVEILPFERWKNGWFMVKEYRDVDKPSTESLKNELEVLRKDMASVSQQTHMLATQLYSEILGGDKFQHSVIYTDGYRHLHPADVVRLQNGDLLLTTREGNEHVSNDGDVIMLRSKDGGKTWGEKQVIANIKNLDEREGCGLQLRDGTIVMGIFYNNLYSKEGVYGARLNSADDSDSKFSDPLRTGSYIITSDDNGLTWSEPNFIDTKDMPFVNVEGPTDAPIEMPDGSILMAIIGYNFEEEVGNRASVMIKSTDKGKTWEYLSVIASDPGSKLGGFLEPGIVRTSTGRIVIVMRNHGGDHAMYSTYSDDDGKTWVPVQKTDMIGHPADLIQLSDGRLMATYGIRELMHTKPGGIRACFSNDNGETWDIATEVQLRNDFINWDIGYPESIEMSDGQILTVYYYNLFGKYFIGGTWWRPDSF